MSQWIESGRLPPVALPVLILMVEFDENGLYEDNDIYVGCWSDELENYEY